MLFNIKVVDGNTEIIFSVLDGLSYDQVEDKLYIYDKKVSIPIDNLQLGFNIGDARGKELFLGDTVVYKGNTYFLDFESNVGVVLKSIEDKKEVILFSDVKGVNYIADYRLHNTLERVNKKFKTPEYLYHKSVIGLKDLRFDGVPKVSAPNLGAEVPISVFSLRQKVGDNAYIGKNSVKIFKGKIF